MISDDDIEKALDYLRDSSEVAAQAVALKIYLTEYRKTKKADLMNLCNEQSEAAKERFAYSHPEMKEFLVGLREAVYQANKHLFLREAADAKIRAWQTQNANQRTMEKIT
jgi:hypothetical protein